MSTHPPSIIDALQAQRAELDAAAQAEIRARRADLESAIRALDEKWSAVDRKHARSLKESTSEAWTSSLQSLYAERKRKNDDARSQLVAELDNLPTDATLGSLDAQQLEAALALIDDEISKYRDTLSIRRRQTEYAGDYGEIDDEKWRKEVARFVDCNPNVNMAVSRLLRLSEEAGLSVDWAVVVAQRVNEQIEPAASLPDAAPSDGGSFEHSCLLVLQNTGWTTTLTPPVGDQGVDILAKKSDLSVAIQCKNYRTPVGNSAVQEVHAGKAFSEADIGVVVSRSGYTPSASQLAKKLRILLLDEASLWKLEDLL